jgi:hypothetical protein
MARGVQVPTWALLETMVNEGGAAISMKPTDELHKDWRERYAKQLDKFEERKMTDVDIPAADAIVCRRMSRIFRTLIAEQAPGKKQFFGKDNDAEKERYEECLEQLRAGKLPPPTELRDIADLLLKKMPAASWVSASDKHFVRSICEAEGNLEAGFIAWLDEYGPPKNPLDSSSFPGLTIEEVKELQLLHSKLTRKR